MMPKSVKRFSGDIMLYLFDLDPASPAQGLKSVRQIQDDIAPLPLL